MNSSSPFLSCRPGSRRGPPKTCSDPVVQETVDAAERLCDKLNRRLRHSCEDWTAFAAQSLRALTPSPARTPGTDTAEGRLIPQAARYLLLPQHG